MTRRVRGWGFGILASLLAMQASVGHAGDELDALLTDEPAETPEAAAGTGEEPARSEADPSGSDGATRPRRVIEEIIVTAQKAERNLRDVPISMSVLDDEFIAQQNITDYRDLGLYVPNAHVDTSNALFPDINIRGFGTALSNTAFEQAVALVLDGIPYGRVAYWQGPLFDVDRVEVLRGPQGTLFGKNATAGLFSVVTKRPTDELTGFVSLEVGELGRQRFEGAVGGPIVPGFLNFRIAGLGDERDGIVENTTADFRPGANDRMTGRDRKGGRLQLAFPDLFGASLVVGYERVEFDYRGTGWEWKEVPERTKPFYRRYDPNTDFEPGNFVGSVDHPELTINRLDTFVANATTKLLGWELAAVAGHSYLEYRNPVDVDFGPAPMLWSDRRDDNPQTTFELRATSPRLPGLLGLDRLFGLGLGETSLTAGVFWQDRDLADSRLRIAFNLPVLAQFAAANNSPEGTPLPALQDFVGPAVPIGDLGLFDTSAGVEETQMDFEQNTESIAGYAQMDWQIVERWTLQYGMRFTQESKEAEWNRSVSQGTGAAFTALGGTPEFMEQRSRSEFVFTPKLSLRWDWTDGMNVWGSWGTGFRAGGFNEQAFNVEDDAMEYATEKAEAWELGTKSRLLGGAATVNLTLFRQDVTDFQVFTLPPNSVATTVVNAGEARAQGVEIDSTWLPTDWLTLAGTLAFNDSEFLSFVFGQCSTDRPDTDGNGDGRCDHSGQPLFRTPKWQSTLVGNVRFPLKSIPLVAAVPPFLSQTDLLGGLTVEYQDVQYLERTYDERVRQGPFFRLGANVGLGDVTRGWTLRLSVENLTDEVTNVLIRDVPLGGGNFAAIPEPPRLFFGSLRWAF